MNAHEKRCFIRALIATVRKDLLADVERMPAEWDGHELRKLIAQRFDAAQMPMAGYRRREFENERRIKNL